jgi:hypothetical protein
VLFVATSKIKFGIFQPCDSYICAIPGCHLMSNIVASAAKSSHYISTAGGLAAEGTICKNIRRRHKKTSLGGWRRRGGGEDALGLASSGRYKADRIFCSLRRLRGIVSLRPHRSNCQLICWTHQRDASNSKILSDIVM